MFVFKLDDVLVHCLDLIRIFAQPNDLGLPAIQQNRVADFESCHLMLTGVPRLRSRPHFEPELPLRESFDCAFVFR